MDAPVVSPACAEMVTLPGSGLMHRSVRSTIICDSLGMESSSFAYPYVNPARPLPPVKNNRNISTLLPPRFFFSFFFFFYSCRYLGQFCLPEQKWRLGPVEESLPERRLQAEHLNDQYGGGFSERVMQEGFERGSRKGFLG